MLTASCIRLTDFCARFVSSSMSLELLRLTSDTGVLASMPCLRNAALKIGAGIGSLRDPRSQLFICLLFGAVRAPRHGLGRRRLPAEQRQEYDVWSHLVLSWEGGVYNRLSESDIA